MAKKTTAVATATQASTVAATEQSNATDQAETAVATVATIQTTAQAEEQAAPAAEVQDAAGETAANEQEQATAEEPETAQESAPEPESAADHPVEVEVEELIGEAVTLVEVVRDASVRAQQESNHAAHAVLEDLLQAVHSMKAKVDAAMVHLDGEAADVIAELRDLL